MSVSLTDRFYGPLTVSIVVGRETHTEFRDFQKCIVGSCTTLFDYVGSVAASVFTNMTTRLSIETAPDEWRVLEFLPEAGVLKAEKIAGELWEIEEDNLDRLDSFLSVIGEEGDPEEHRCPRDPYWN